MFAAQFVVGYRLSLCILPWRMGDTTYIDCQILPLVLRLRISEVDHDIATAFSTEKMWLALLSKEILLQLALAVA